MLARERALEFFDAAGIVLTDAEKDRVEIADFGLSNLGREGLQILTYVNTERVCAKEMALLPRQTCPEHRHPPVDGQPGKEETFRVRSGEVFLYVPGPATQPRQALLQHDHDARYTVFHEIHLRPGDQYTIYPDTPHWFQGGDEGAVVSEFSTPLNRCLRHLHGPGCAARNHDCRMTNFEIARKFTRIADILEIEGENPFKVRAYRRAAEVIENLPEPLAEIDARDALDTIPGFGEAIIAKSRDFLRTGTTKLYEQIKDKVPDGVVQMAAIPGIGPKTVRTLWKELGVTTVDELEAAARAGRVQKVAGFGPGKEKNLIEAIERARRLSERLPLYVALPYAERLARELSARPEVGRIAVAGSIRRRRDTVGDIDLVGTSSDPDATMEAFTRLPGITETLAQGPAETAVLCDLGLRVDLRLTTADNFGALLHHFSSGQAHNIHLRDLAEAKGLKINEYGVFDARSGAEKFRGEDEGQIYTALGLPFIDPELREDRGEIEAAQAGRLPRLIAEEDFRGQIHCHSTYSDGSATIRQMAEAAVARGYKYLAITDHSRSLVIANGLSRERLSPVAAP